MTFSIRTFLIVIAILACWLGALVSKSPLLVELASNATALLILLTLAWALWDSRPEQRAYWTGFFVLGLGNLLLASYFSAYQQTGTQVAQLFLGEPAASTVYGGSGYGPISPAPGNPPMVTYYTPGGPTVNYTTSYAFATPGNSDYYQQHAAIRAAVPNLMSLLAGAIGGWLTLWISRRAKADMTPEPKTGAG